MLYTVLIELLSTIIYWIETLFRHYVNYSQYDLDYDTKIRISTYEYYFAAWRKKILDARTNLSDRFEYCFYEERKNKK